MKQLIYSSSIALVLVLSVLAWTSCAQANEDMNDLQRKNQEFSDFSERIRLKQYIGAKEEGLLTVQTVLFKPARSGSEGLDASTSGAVDEEHSE